MKFITKLCNALPLPSKKTMHNWCIILIVLAASFDAYFPGHDDAVTTLIAGTVVVFFADILFRGW